MIEQTTVAETVAESASKTSSEEPEKLSGRVSRWVLSVSVFLLVYLATAGPMSAVHRSLRLQPLQRLIEIVYAPVVFVIKRDVEPFSWVMRWYVGLFR